MKAGIITYHRVWNYGAAIQCAALYRVLTQMGHDVKVIDYHPRYAQHCFVLQNPLRKAREGWGYGRNLPLPRRVLCALRWFAGGIRSYATIPARRQLAEKFGSFMTDHVRLTETYPSIRALRRNPPRMDLYICGSDQIWNPIATRGTLDGAYYLQFGGDGVRRAAYAASCCRLDVPRHRETLNAYLQRLDFVSLRENDEKLQQLAALTGKEICHAPDPTLLLEAEDYLPMERSVPELEGRRFTLVYMLASSEKETREKAAAYFACSGRIGSGDVLTVDISPDQLAQGAMHLKGIGPAEFLWLIRHAAFVATNSFHAMVFSALFGTDFAVLPRGGMNARVTGLAERLGLEAKLIGDDALAARDAAAIRACEAWRPDTDAVEAALAAMRQEGRRLIAEKVVKG